MAHKPNSIFGAYGSQNKEEVIEIKEDVVVEIEHYEDPEIQISTSDGLYYENDYEKLKNKPKINGTELIGDLKTEELFKEATEEQSGLMSAADKVKLNNIEEGAQENVIEKIIVQGKEIEPVNKIVELDEIIDKNYKHTQTSSESTWYINHNLGKNPSVVTVDNYNREILGEVEYIDNNNLKIIFTSLNSGFAYLN